MLITTTKGLVAYHASLRRQYQRRQRSHRAKGTDMKRDELQFQLSYSFFMESMHARLYAKIDKLLTFTQLVLGSSVFASFGENWALGIALVTLSSLSFVWQPAAKSNLYASRADTYAKLMSTCDDLSDQQLQEEMTNSIENIHDEVGALCAVAHKRATIQLGRGTGGKLSPYETFIGWLACDVPHS